ncbi:hypothetical protein ACFSOZ_11555 [Mesorhizobium newzealandense]|uniref:Uncharacterized protein n=1 Tax=Mesorhizobium newzealandense TaxID=1300302 RepID=A0ABW4UB39_9HYPH
MDEQLALLYDQSRTLTKAIGDIDYEINHWLPRMEADSDPKRIISFLQDRHSIQRVHIHQLGKVEGQIEDLELRVRDLELEESRQPTTLSSEPLRAIENHLDWLSHIGTLVQQSDGPLRADTENHLDWLDTGTQEPPDGREEPQMPEPDRERR